MGKTHLFNPTSNLGWVWNLGWRQSWERNKPKLKPHKPQQELPIGNGVNSFSGCKFISGCCKFIFQCVNSFSGYKLIFGCCKFIFRCVNSFSGVQIHFLYLKVEAVQADHVVVLLSALPLLWETKNDEFRVRNWILSTEICRDFLSHLHFCFSSCSLTRVKSQCGPGVRNVKELPLLRGYLSAEKKKKKKLLSS